MKPTQFAGTLAGIIALASSASAQAVDLYWADSAQDGFHIFRDLNGDGDYKDLPDEVAYFWTDPLFGANNDFSPRDIQVRDEAGTGVAYSVDTVTDVVYRYVDANADGEIQPGEQTVFYTMGSAGPDGIEFGDDGAVWFCSDSGIAGITRLVDLNGDGDADDAGESNLIVDANSVVSVSHDLGTGTIDAGQFDRLANAGNGVVGYCTGDDEAAYRFEDLNGDGDVTDPGEAVLFLNASGKRLDLPQNPDFADGTLKSLNIDETVGGLTFEAFGRLSYLTSSVEGGERAYYFGCDSTTTGSFGINENGEAINALIFRGVDANNDRDINDAGEVVMFYDGSTGGAGPNVFGAILGLDATDEGGAVYVCDLNDKGLHRMQDMNGDGDAMDPGELEFGTFFQSSWGPVDPFAVTAAFAFVRELAVAPKGLFDTPVFGVSGTGCTLAGSTIPEISGTGSGVQGTNFNVAVSNAAPNNIAFMWWGISTTQFSPGVPLPLDLTPFGYPGCFLYHTLTGNLTGVTDATGSEDITFTIPTDAGLAGFALPLQWILVDPVSFAPEFSNLGVLNFQ